MPAYATNIVVFQVEIFSLVEMSRINKQIQKLEFCYKYPKDLSLSEYKNESFWLYSQNIIYVFKHEYSCQETEEKIEKKRKVWERERRRRIKRR